jgi:hypothetical protein
LPLATIYTTACRSDFYVISGEPQLAAGNCYLCHAVFGKKPFSWAMIKGAASAELAWLRWWDSDGNLLLTGWEMTKLSEVRLEQERAKSEQAQLVADQERARADQERARADQERAKSQRLAEKLRAAGIDPDL